jgi:preprotein translocase subunit YajC
MTTNLLVVFLQAKAAPGGDWSMPVMLVLMGVVMYFFILRPQSKRAKEQKKFSEGIAVGDNVVLTSGIHGRINRVNEDGTLKIEINHGTFMTIDRAAVSQDMTVAHRKKVETATTSTSSTPIPAK